MRNRLFLVGFVALAIVCAAGQGQPAAAQGFRVAPVGPRTPIGIGGAGAVGGSGLNTGLGTGPDLNLNLGNSLEGVLVVPTSPPIDTSTGIGAGSVSSSPNEWGSGNYHGSNESTTHSTGSTAVTEPTHDRDEETHSTSSLSHSPVVNAGDPPGPPEGGGDDGDDSGDEDEDEENGFPWLWAVLGIVALAVIFGR